MDDLAMMVEVDARRILSERNLAFSVLSPLYPALGCGKLRVLRIQERGARFEIITGYETYERIVT
ncbi:MAG: hypothetical protein M3160_09650 [Candidatus Eremiobacteraeota bacterium]|nr:hypothetical protein [Candidatus Eremiobacteraeota bacterium]